LSRDQFKSGEMTKLTIAQQQIDLELGRLGFQSGVSDRDAYMAAQRVAHDQQMAEATLVKSFSEQLLSADKKANLFALSVLSAYVNPEVIRQLAAAGEELVSNEALKVLASNNGYEIAKVAKEIQKARQMP
jgi:hypothetical protein